MEGHDTFTNVIYTQEPFARPPNSTFTTVIPRNFCPPSRGWRNENDGSDKGFRSVWYFGERGDKRENTKLDSFVKIVSRDYEETHMKLFQKVNPDSTYMS